jgi:hypothetical protein
VVADELNKLADLLDRGLISTEEFQVQKTRLLAAPDSPPPYAPNYSAPDAPPQPRPPKTGWEITPGAAVLATFVFSPLGIVLGHIALSRAKREGDEPRVGRAKGALVFSYLWTVAALVLIAVAVAKSSTPQGPPLSELTANVQSQITGSGPDNFGVSGVSNVVCNPPSSWSSGNTFSCFAYNSSDQEVGEYDATIEPNGANGSYQWNARWLPAAIP